MKTPVAGSGRLEPLSIYSLDSAADHWIDMMALASTRLDVMYDED